MGEVRRWYISCDECGEISDHTQRTVAEARRLAREVDGFFRVLGKWYCAVCKNTLWKRSV